MRIIGIDKDSPLIGQLIFSPRATPRPAAAISSHGIGPAEVAERKAEIQAGWSAKERSLRLDEKYKRWEFPVVHHVAGEKDVFA